MSEYRLRVSAAEPDSLSFFSNLWIVHVWVREKFLAFVVAARYGSSSLIAVGLTL